MTTTPFTARLLAESQRLLAESLAVWLMRKRLRLVQQGDLFLVQELIRSRCPWRRPTWKTIYATKQEDEALVIHYCRHREIGLPCV